MTRAQLTDAQRGIIEAEYWHDLEAAHPTALIPGAVRTHWSDGESFVILANGEVDQFHYDTDTGAGKRRLPEAPVILEMMRDHTLSEVARMLGCTPAGVSNRLARHRQAVEATGAQIAGAAIAQAVAAARGKR